MVRHRYHLYQNLSKCSYAHINNYATNRTTSPLTAVTGIKSVFGDHNIKSMTNEEGFSVCRNDIAPGILAVLRTRIHCSPEETAKNLWRLFDKLLDLLICSNTTELLMFGMFQMYSNVANASSIYILKSVLLLSTSSLFVVVLWLK